MTRWRSPLDVDAVGDGPNLLLLHGGAGSREDLAELRALIGPGRRVIAPDQRGHGRSRDLGELSYPVMAADTAALLDELEARGVDVIGFSDGGIIALLLARDRPDLIGRVVAIGANVSWAPPAPPIYSDDFVARLAALTSSELPLPDVRRGLAGAESDWPAIVNKLKAMWIGEPGITLADLVRFTVPILYVVGDGDRRVEHTVAMYRATPGSQLAVIPGAPHDVAGSRPADIAAIARLFLDRMRPDDRHPSAP